MIHAHDRPGTAPVPALAVSAIVIAISSIICLICLFARILSLPGMAGWIASSVLLALRWPLFGRMVGQMLSGGLGALRAALFFLLSFAGIALVLLVCVWLEKRSGSSLKGLALSAGLGICLTEILLIAISFFSALRANARAAGTEGGPK